MTDERSGWRRRTLTITVDPMPGSHIQDLAADMLTLSQLLDIGVRANVNGVRLLAFPAHSVDDLRRQYKIGITELRATMDTASPAA